MDRTRTKAGIIKNPWNPWLLLEGPKQLRIVELPGVDYRGCRAVFEALGRLSATPCDIVDCLRAARARSRDLTVYSFDRGCERLGGAWEEPV